MVEARIVSVDDEQRVGEPARYNCENGLAEPTERCHDEPDNHEEVVETVAVFELQSAISDHHDSFRIHTNCRTGTGFSFNFLSAKSFLKTKHASRSSMK